jgi:hypothetical protein
MELWGIDFLYPYLLSMKYSRRFRKVNFKEFLNGSKLVNENLWQMENKFWVRIDDRK